ncbi:MAG: YsnF/AvaK domain-containing protein [Alphaproteobacteria bacterium]|nr:YsnF/AvaK domain-containing protein [Alphaproteobacteria bacterium]
MDTKNDEISIPLAEERATIVKTAVTTGTVRVTKTTQSRERLFEEPLRIEEVDVDRIPIDAWVDGPMPTRQEGDTTIVPVIEEVAFVQKRFRLVAEVRITRRVRFETFSEAVELRGTDVAVERHSPNKQEGEE